jgi:hypothetical protein
MAINAYAPSAIHKRFMRTHSIETWCTGEDSNLRSSKERQVYSLLPLTARPPVHKPTAEYSGPAAAAS